MAKLKAVMAERGWELLESLSGGGQAKTHFVRRLDKPDGPKYVLKELRNVESQQAIQRFQQEIEAVQRLSHPYIVKVVDHSKRGDDIHFYVMDYVDQARPVGQVVGKAGSLFYQNPVKSLQAFVGICEALVACEKAKVVHRDLSPGNVLLTPDDDIRLIDFGCCQLEGGECITLIDEAIGTPNYRAPECEGPVKGPISTQADLYSAGKILWSLVTNRRAFAREAPVFNEMSLASVLPSCPMAWHLHHIFEKTIRSKPADRYDCALDALGESEKVLRRIQSGFLPLEILAGGTCPICATEKLVPLMSIWDDLVNSDGPTLSLPPNDGSWNYQFVCEHCGFATMRFARKAAQNLKQRQKLS